MDSKQLLLAELLKTKAALLQMLSHGNFHLHPQEVIDQLNNIINLVDTQDN